MTAAFAASGVITLLTDFGISDPFVGVMTGAILSRFRAATVVDLCHGIRPQSISEAAFWIERCHPWFPPGTVHVAVVDPGVGSERRILAAEVAGHCFLAPDNGLLGRLLTTPGARVVAVEPSRLGIRTPSATFHGRDVFAPLAAALASGERAPSSLGLTAAPKASVLPAPTRDGDAVVGEIVTVDRFGNLISNVGVELLRDIGATRVSIGGRSIPVHRTYSDVGTGELLALINAFDVLEVAARDANAAAVLGVDRGARVEVTGRPGRASTRHDAG